MTPICGPGAHEASVLSAVLLVVIGTLMLGAAIVDGRTRTFPNVLFAALGLACASRTLVAHGFAGLASNVLAALVFCGALTAWELAWRHFHAGQAGMGMGDVKFTGALMLADSVLGAASLVLALPIMAVTGLLLRRDSLPLIPFAVGACAVLVAIAAV